MIGYPGNGDYPVTYQVVKVILQSRGADKTKFFGHALWTGKKWSGCGGLLIGNRKVIKWESKE